MTIEIILYAIGIIAWLIVLISDKKSLKYIFLYVLLVSFLMWGLLLENRTERKFKNCLLKDGVIEYHIDSITGKRFLVATDSTLLETNKMFIK